MAQIVPDWLRIILSLLSGASFLPQMHRIWVHGNSHGISLGYLLINLISATEQFTVGFYYVSFPQKNEIFIGSPLRTGDWLNLAQLALVWVLHLLLFSLCLWFPSDNCKSSKFWMLATYILFALISIIPLFLHTINQDVLPFNPKHDWQHNWQAIMFGFLHLLFINPIIQILAFVALPYQVRAIHALPPGDLKSISLQGLLAQGLVFGGLAISWIFRVEYTFRQGFVQILDWYHNVGWAAVGNAVFAIVQLVLFILANRRLVKTPAHDGETEPLLQALDVTV